MCGLSSNATAKYGTSTCPRTTTPSKCSRERPLIRDGSRASKRERHSVEVPQEAARVQREQ
jgi:hypothetical protein